MAWSKKVTNPFRSGLSGGVASSSVEYEIKISVAAAPVSSGCRLSKKLLKYVIRQASSGRLPSRPAEPLSRDQNWLKRINSGSASIARGGNPGTPSWLATVILTSFVAAFLLGLVTALHRRQIVSEGAEMLVGRLSSSLIDPNETLDVHCNPLSGCTTACIPAD
jgi:hypothetical protein